MDKDDRKNVKINPLRHRWIRAVAGDLGVTIEAALDLVLSLDPRAIAALELARERINIEAD